MRQLVLVRGSSSWSEAAGPPCWTMTKSTWARNPTKQSWLGLGVKVGEDVQGLGIDDLDKELDKQCLVHALHIAVEAMEATAQRQGDVGMSGEDLLRVMWT